MRRPATFVFLVALFWANADDARCQLPTVRGFYLNVPLWSDPGPYAVGGFGDLQRLRIMTSPTYGQLTFEVAYEQLISYSARAVSQVGQAVIGGLTPGGGEYWNLQWTIKDTDHWNWRHRFDRLNVTFAPNEPFELTFGRQTISWATTLFLTPADPFIPFDPADPFRYYRAGVDALRVQVFPSTLSDLDFVVRPSKSALGESLTLLGRGRSVWKNWEISAWAGLINDGPGAALGASGAVAGWAVRTELSLREENDDPVLRGALGVDRNFVVGNRDLYLVFEYQRDGFGAASSDELLSVLFSEPFVNGEMQVLGRDEVDAQAAYQIHPLWSVSLFLLGNLNDPSLLIQPGAAYSLSNEVTVQGGIFLGVGDGTAESEFEIPSEYGIVPTSVYVSLTAFF